MWKPKNSWSATLTTAFILVGRRYFFDGEKKSTDLVNPWSPTPFPTGIPVLTSIHRWAMAFSRLSRPSTDREHLVFSSIPSEPWHSHGFQPWSYCGTPGLNQHLSVVHGVLMAHGPTGEHPVLTSISRWVKVCSRLPPPPGDTRYWPASPGGSWDFHGKLVNYYYLPYCQRPRPFWISRSFHDTPRSKTQC